MSKWAHIARDLARSSLHVLAARGWCGLVPLELHIVICGHARAGTTLLKSMLEAAYPEAYSHPREKRALRMASRFWPGRESMLISKQPNDVLQIDEIREWYRERSARVCFLVLTRDPRDVLTSRHPDRLGYYVSPERWRERHTAITQYRYEPDVSVIDYQELVTATAAIEARVQAFIGRPTQRAFEDFHHHVRPEMRVTAMNGVRPVSAERIGRWRDPVHADRLRQMVKALPELPEVVVREGYDVDASWAFWI